MWRNGNKLNVYLDDISRFAGRIPDMSSRIAGKLPEVRARRYAPLAIAVQDVLWMAVLVPLAVAFHGLLMLARGYYMARRRGNGWAVGYMAAVLGLMIWLRMRVRTSGGAR